MMEKAISNRNAVNKETGREDTMTKLVQMLQEKEMSLIVSLPSNNYEVFQAAV